MATFFKVAWLLVCVCAGVTAGHVTPTPSVGKPVTENLHGIEQLLKPSQQTQQCPCFAGNGSGANHLSLKNKMSVLETKLEAMQTNLETTQRNLEATQRNLEATQRRLETAESKQEAAETKLEAAETKLESAETKLEAAEATLDAAGAELQSTKTLLQAKMKSGSTFVRWGRKTCTNASELVYSGVAGGGYHDHTGAAVNALCLTMTPQTEPITLPSAYTYLCGAEYEQIQNHHNQDAPCSVCHATQSATIMIPATRSCPAGWTTQYTGHLVAGHYSSKAATEYVCLDGDPENMPSGDHNHNGRLFYYTLTACGSLPCPPYSNKAVVLCVVCSK